MKTQSRFRFTHAISAKVGTHALTVIYVTIHELKAFNRGDWKPGRRIEFAEVKDDRWWRSETTTGIVDRTENGIAFITRQ